jgi:hypothetical protein
MPLFARGHRTRLEALRRGERLFAFYDSCGRTGYEEFRALVNVWLSEMPDQARTDLISRMRDSTDQDFQAGLFELVIHAMLVRLSHDVVVHPEIPSRSRQPDFRADHRQSKISTYVEATTINPPAEENAERNRESPVYNAIDGARLPPGCLLGYELRQAGSNSPPLGELVRSVEGWARENAEVAIAEPITRVFEFYGWAIELQLFAGGRGTEPPARAIGAINEGGGWIAPHQDLRSTLERKARRYGDLNAPYLIAVADAKDQIWGADDVVETALEALLGDEAVEVAQGSSPRSVRLRNGFWFAGGKPSNENISGVLLVPTATLWTLRSREHQPILAINHWADHRLPEPFFRLRHIARDSDRNIWRLHEGTSLADVLGLPIPWPPEGDG